MIRSRSVCAMSGKGSGGAPSFGPETSGPKGGPDGRGSAPAVDNIADVRDKAGALFEQVVGAG